MDLPVRHLSVDPNKYFTELLPARFEENKSTLPPEVLSVSAAISFQLFGFGGGTWTLRLEAGKLTGTPGEVEDRIVKIVQKVEDWHSAITGEKGFKFDMRGEASDKNAIGEIFLNPEKLDQLKKITGAIKFRLRALGTSNWEITAVFGPDTPPEPNCTISLSETDATAIRNGTLNPQEAFMSGKINIKGDIGFAMQISAALMA